MSVAVQRDRISNRCLRQEFERRRDLGWVTLVDLANRLDMRNYSHGGPDVSRVARMLGLADSYQRDGVPRRQTTISYERAVEIAEAMNCDPVDVGL